MPGSMSSSLSESPACAAPGLPIAATANYSIAAIVLALFVLAAVLGAERKDVTRGFDEVAHASYVAAIQRSGNAWPALAQMRLLDPKTFQFTDQANYLNHPPIYYALHALLGPKLEGRPQALLAHRLIDIALAAIGFAALLGIGLAARFPRYEFYAYAVPLACIPVLAPLAGSVNNDNLAFLGGAFATLGAWQCIATGRRGWLALAFVGVVAAGWAKLTGLLLTAALVSGVIAYLLWQRRLPWRWAAAALLVFALAAAPYIAFILQYGSPTPETPAQIALIENGARAAGWADLPRRSFPAYLSYFIVAFVAQWMPTLAPRNLLNYAMLAIPVAALACALAGIALSAHRLRRRTETALDVVVIGGTLAFAATFAIHVAYSYGRYVATGWLMDAYPRYYLPLAAIVPLACLSLLAAIDAPRWRGALLGFLIAGPIVFRLLGAPLSLG
jgi:hypothetical protein